MLAENHDDGGAGLIDGLLTTGTAAHRLAAGWRTAVYLLLVLSPAVAGGFLGSPATGGFLRTAARFMGMTGFSILFLQPFLASRFRWFERPFGLDRLLRLHRMTGIAGTILALAHPVFLALSAGSAFLLVGTGLPPYLTAGRLTLVLLLLFGIAALFHSRLRMPFQWWFRGHSWLTPAILAGVFLHSYNAGYKPTEIRILWFALAAVGSFSYLHLTLYRRLGGRFRPWTVEKVDRVAGDIWDMSLVPPAGREVFDCLPGQFLFVTLLRGRGLPREEHPFTISSSPASKGSVRITPKELGDFTRTIGNTRAGDHAAVMAPYGRFSYLLRPETPQICMIAGGIGITPMMSMLRHMRDTGADREVLLLNACRTEEDIIFRHELEEMSASEDRPNLRVVHVLSRPDPSWEGEKGYVDRDRIEKYAGDVSTTGFYVCGPPPMMAMVGSVLTGMGTPADSIHMERFSL